MLFTVPRWKKRGYAGLDQYRRPVERHSLAELAALLVHLPSFAAIGDARPKRCSDLADEVEKLLEDIPLDVFHRWAGAKHNVSQPAAIEIAEAVHRELCSRYQFERIVTHLIGHATDWDKAFRERFGL